jgi:hypothetical protein
MFLTLGHDLTGKNASSNHGFRSAALFCAAVFFGASLLAPPALAQEARGTITGIVTDPTGAVLVGATVEARHVQTNEVAQTIANTSGVYTLPFLRPGIYEISATAAGFKKAIREKVELRVGDRLEINIPMEIGGITEQVTVSAEAELLQTATSNSGQVIGKENVKDLPLLGRNPFMLAAIATGVQYTPTRQSRSNRPFDNGGMDNFSMNGGRQFSNEFLLDGVPNTNTETTGPSNLSFVPSPDATEEFKVQTNTYDAQYGRTGGGAINVSVKSGTNQFHGNLYYYLRNDKLNANAFEANAAGNNRTAFRWAQPGVQFDGPVMLPKIYDGRNRTFFMYSWEKIKSKIPFPQTYTVATALERQGNFTQTLQPNLTPITIYDPLTTVAAGTGYIRQPFAGNIIPANRIDPVAKNIVGYIAQPNTPGNARNFFNLVATPNSVSDEYDQQIIRLDQQLGSKHRFFTRYVRGNRHEENSFGGYTRDASPWYDHWRINQGGNFDLTSALSPTMVLVSRVGYIRHQFAIQQHTEGFDPATLGFPSSIVDPLPRKFFPRMVFTDYSAFGPQRSTGSEFTFSDTWSWSETLSKVVGSHSIKTGFEYRMMLNNQQRPTSSFARFDFNRVFTQRNPLAGDAASGNAFAAMLLGYPTSGSSSRLAEPAYSNNYWVGFIQDDWKLTRKLTLNLGLRWDYESPIVERWDRQNIGFDSTSTSNLQVPGMQLRGGLLFSGVGGTRLPVVRDRNNWQPRIGAAYQIASRTVFRGGYGLSFLPTFNPGGNWGFSVDTPFVASIDNNITPYNSLSNPFPEGYVAEPGSSLGLATLAGNSFNYTNSDRVVPFVHQYSFGIQHELPWRLLIDASYIGSTTRSLQANKGINEVSEADLGLGSALNQQVPNPFARLLPGTPLNAPTVARSQLLRPFPQFLGITENSRSVGSTWFNSFQLRVEKRFSHGFHMLGSYTLSKSIEQVGYLNAQADWHQFDRVLTAVDAPHRFILSGGWTLPWFNAGPGWQKQLLGGWQIMGIMTAQSGQPIGAPGSAVSSGISPKIDNPTREMWFNPCSLTVAGARQNCRTADQQPAFFVQPPFTLRTLGARFPNIRNARPTYFDFSVFKSFPISEQVRMQFRAEAFNALNTPWFGNPNTTISSANFGIVSPSQANDPRNIQLALRLEF